MADEALSPEELAEVERMVMEQATADLIRESKEAERPTGLAFAAAAAPAGTDCERPLTAETMGAGWSAEELATPAGQQRAALQAAATTTEQTAAAAARAKTPETTQSARWSESTGAAVEKPTTPSTPWTAGTPAVFNSGSIVAFDPDADAAQRALHPPVQQQPEPLGSYRSELSGAEEAEKLGISDAEAFWTDEPGKRTERLALEFLQGCIVGYAARSWPLIMLRCLRRLRCAGSSLFASGC